MAAFASKRRAVSRGGNNSKNIGSGRSHLIKENEAKNYNSLGGGGGSKSKFFYFFPIIKGTKQRNVLLCLRQFPDQIKLLCFSPEFLDQNENDLLAIQFFMYHIKMFCFRSDNKQTKSKSFAFVPIISFDIETFVLSFRYR
jgi:hypothetical protein